MSTQMTDSERIKDERTFLHDVSGAFAMTLFILDALVEDLEGNPAITSEQKGELKIALQSLEKATKLIEARRALVKAETPAP